MMPTKKQREEISALLYISFIKGGLCYKNEITIKQWLDWREGVLKELK